MLHKYQKEKLPEVTEQVLVSFLCFPQDIRQMYRHVDSCQMSTYTFILIRLWFMALEDASRVMRDAGGYIFFFRIGEEMSRPMRALRHRACEVATGVRACQHREGVPRMHG